MRRRDRPLQEVRHHPETSKALAPSKWTGAVAERQGRGRKTAEMTSSRAFRKEDLELEMATAFDCVLERRSRERQASTGHEAKVASENRETDFQSLAAGSVFAMKVPKARHKAAG